MRRDVAAEWILRLVMSRERAAAVAGDLLEDSAGRDSSWFWISMAGTIASTVWRDAQTHAWQLAGVSAAGFFFQMILSVGANLAAWLVWTSVHFVRDHTGLELLLPGASLPLSVPVWVTIFYLRLLVPFEVGRWVARRAPGRELSSGLVMMLLWPLLASLTKSPYEFAWVSQFALLGAICERWRTSRRPTPN